MTDRLDKRNAETYGGADVSPLGVKNFSKSSLSANGLSTVSARESRLDE